MFKDHGNDCADTLPKRPLKQRWARINYTDFSNDKSAHWNRQLSRQLCITTRTNVSDKLPKDQLQGIQLGLSFRIPQRHMLRSSIPRINQTFPERQLCITTKQRGRGHANISIFDPQITTTQYCRLNRLR